MLRNLIAFSLNYRLVVLMLAVGMMICGASRRARAVGRFPEFAPPQVLFKPKPPVFPPSRLSSLSRYPSSRRSTAFRASTRFAHRRHSVYRWSPPSLQKARTSCGHGTCQRTARSSADDVADGRRNAAYGAAENIAQQIGDDRPDLQNPFGSGTPHPGRLDVSATLAGGAGWHSSEIFGGDINSIRCSSTRSSSATTRLHSSM